MSAVKTMIFISVVVIGAVSLLTNFSFSPAVDTLIYYHHCSQPKYFPGSFLFSSKYFPRWSSESNVNSLLTSLVNSAALLNAYDHFTVHGISGMYHCRGDRFSRPGDCARCVAQAVRRLPGLCVGACGGALLLEGCFVEYGNDVFLGVANKTVLARMCGTPHGYNPSELTKTNALVTVVTAWRGVASREARSGESQAVAQCTRDLSASDCQDCLMEAIQQLKSLCGTTAWGDVHSARCYVRYSSPGATGHEYKTKTLPSELAQTTQHLAMDGSKSIFVIIVITVVNKLKSLLLFAFYVFLFVFMLYIYFICF